MINLLAHLGPARLDAALGGAGLIRHAGRVRRREQHGRADITADTGSTTGSRLPGNQGSADGTA